MAVPSDSQWPLSAAATHTLRTLAGDGKTKVLKYKDSEPTKLALKELLVRGAFSMSIEQLRLGRKRVTLLPGEPVGALAPPLARLHAELAAEVPGDIKDVFRLARKRNRDFVKDVSAAAREELAGRGLVVEGTYRFLWLFPTQTWGRSAEGDAWAVAAAQHQEALATLEADLRENPEAGRQTAMATGAMIVMAPGAMGLIALEQRRWRESGPVPAGGPDGSGDSDGSGDPGDPTIDVFGGVGDLFDSVLDSLDQGIDAIEGAVDSVAGSIDSAVDAGVDGAAGGGGDGGGGDGGGGGN